MFTYLTNKQREERMILHLMHKAKISEVESKDLLVKNNWNIKKLLSDLRGMQHD